MGIYYDICVGACLTNITAYAGNMSVTVRVTRDMNYFPVSLSFVPVTESDAYEPTAHKKYKIKLTNMELDNKCKYKTSYMYTLELCTVY